MTTKVSLYYTCDECGKTVTHELDVTSEDKVDVILPDGWYEVWAKSEKFILDIELRCDKC